MLQTANKTTKFIFLISSITILLFASCKDDDPTIQAPLVYDAASHIYGTTFKAGIGSWETIIDLETGQFDTIPGTKEPVGALDLPIGVRELTDFDANRRIFVDGSDLIIQDLETTTKTTIKLLDPIYPDTEIYIIRFQYLNFGRNKDEIYGISTYNQPYLINLATQTIELISIDVFSLDFDQIDDFIYLEDQNDFVFIGQKYSVDDSYFVSVYDLDANAFTIYDSIPKSFGFVKDHASDRIYALSFPTDNHGFRLMSLDIRDDDVRSILISTENLAIDNLSFYMQTIHTASNSYICRGGSASIEVPENMLYSVDLTTGELKNSIILDDYGIMKSLKGE